MFTDIMCLIYSLHHLKIDDQFDVLIPTGQWSGAIRAAHIHIGHACGWRCFASLCVA
jgi:hypothetical protein